MTETALSSPEFQKAWAGRDQSRARPFTTTLPVMLDGEIVDDLEEVNANHSSRLHVTPIVHNSAIVLAVFTDRAAMLQEAEQMIGNAELPRLLDGLDANPSRQTTRSEERELTVVYRELRVYDDPDVAGASWLDLRPERAFRNLALIRRRGSLNWDNAVRLVRECQCPYSAFSEPDYKGTEWFINFRATYRPAWGPEVSSLVNWGSKPPG